MKAGTEPAACKNCANAEAIQWPRRKNYYCGLSCAHVAGASYCRQHEPRVKPLIVIDMTDHKSKWETRGR
jgi:hypothetical protein